MSTGTPVSNVETISSTSLGHSRGRGHSRFSRSHTPSSLQLSVDQPSAPDVPQPVTDTSHTNGHASHGSHSHSHLHPHPHSHSHSHTRTYSNNAAAFDDSFHDHGANGKRASGIIAQAIDLKKSDIAAGLTENEAGQK